MNRREMNGTRNDRRGGAPPQSYDYARGVESSEEGIDLKELFTIVRGGKWWIISIAAGVFALALLYIFIAKPVYQADGMIQVQQQDQAGSAGNALSFLLPMAEPAQAEMSIMSSRAVLGPVVRKLHLSIEVSTSGIPIIKNLFGSSDVSNISVEKLQVPDDWKDQELMLRSSGNSRYSLESPSGTVVLHGVVGKLATADGGNVQVLVTKFDVPEGKEFNLVRLYDQEAVADLQKKLTTTQLGNNTGIVQLTLDGHSPTGVKDVLNAIEAQYIKQNVRTMASQARDSLAFIHRELPELKKTLDAAQGRLTQFMQKNGAIALDQQSQALLQELTTLESQLGQINLAEAQMRQRYTKNFPGYKALESQQNTIQDKIAALKGAMSALPKKEQTYMDLTQQVQAYQQLYTALLAKVQDLQIAQAGTVGSARIVDHAVRPIRPIAPRKTLIVVLGLILGLFLGVLVVFLRKALTRSIEDAAVLESEFGLPVYGVIPHSSKQAAIARKASKEDGSRIPLLFHEDPGDPVVESIRSLRTGLSFALMSDDDRIISIGGCAPGAGKSFLSVTLAHVAGNADSRVLLVDADLRRGHLERYVGGVKSPGLSELLSGKANKESVIQVSPYTNDVDFLPSGAYPPNPFELLSSPRLEALLNESAAEYDLVIVDVPPILSVADAAVIAKLCSANFLVVRSGQQTPQEVRMALSRFEQNGAHVLGFILNDLSAQAQGYTFGKYGGAYKRYRYDSKKK